MRHNNTGDDDYDEKAIVGVLQSVSSSFYLAIFDKNDEFVAGLHEKPAQYWEYKPRLGIIAARDMGVALKAKGNDVLLEDLNAEQDFDDANELGYWAMTPRTGHIMLLANGRSLTVGVAREGMPVKLAVTKLHEEKQVWDFLTIQTKTPSLAPSALPPFVSENEAPMDPLSVTASYPLLAALALSVFCIACCCAKLVNAMFSETKQQDQIREPAKRRSLRSKAHEYLKEERVEGNPFFTVIETPITIEAETRAEGEFTDETSDEGDPDDDTAPMLGGSRNCDAKSVSPNSIGQALFSVFGFSFRNRGESETPAPSAKPSTSESASSVKPEAHDHRIIDPESPEGTGKDTNEEEVYGKLDVSDIELEDYEPVEGLAHDILEVTETAAYENLERGAENGVEMIAKDTEGTETIRKDQKKKGKKSRQKRKKTKRNSNKSKGFFSSSDSESGKDKRKRSSSKVNVVDEDPDDIPAGVQSFRMQKEASTSEDDESDYCGGYYNRSGRSSGRNYEKEEDKDVLSSFIPMS